MRLLIFFLLALALSMAVWASTGWAFGASPVSIVFAALGGLLGSLAVNVPKGWRRRRAEVPTPAEPRCGGLLCRAYYPPKGSSVASYVEEHDLKTCPRITRKDLDRGEQLAREHGWD